ncbi:MAG: DMT family transporter [Lysobacterales bacterium]|nr:MAG: DMT family transporter [Xanthomonadales bacterium]
MCKALVAGPTEFASRAGTRLTVRRRDTPGFAYAVLTLTAFLFACNHIIGRAVHGEVPPVGLSFWRWVVGILVLLPFVLRHGSERWPIYRRHWPAFALLGLFMIGSTTLVLVALSMTSAINVSLINAVQPTLTVLFAWLFLKEALSARRTVGIVCGAVGVAVMVSRADLALLASLEFQPGDFVALLAMCGFSGYALNLHRLPRGLSEVESLFAITVAGTALLLPFYLVESIVWKPVPVSTTSIGAILALALLVSVFGNLMWNAGNRMIGPARATIFINLIPVFGSVLAMIFLDERLYAYHLAGGALVGLGLYLAAVKRRASSPNGNA